jgi:hypothetical protein
MNKEDLKAAIRQIIEQLPIDSRALVSRVRLFGSRLHGKERKESDVDLLIEFTRPVGFFTLIALEQELARQLSLPVDLRTPAEISPYVRDEVFSSAELVYGE